MRKFKPVDSKVNFPELEEETLKFWKENKIFEKSVDKKAPKGNWTFLDGPPFVTGMPHYGTLLSSIPKDLFGRYWTMKGYHVRRVWGWDGHGLPIENKVENKLHIKRKRDIEDKVGVKKFVDECLSYVQTVSAEWEWYVDHIGRWVDFKNAYKTWDLPYMETVMWVFKQIYEKGYIYKGLRVSLYCPHCVTPISNFEVAMDSDNYIELTEPSDTYKYELKDEPNTYLLAWSTTPWNKIATTALAVNPKYKYVKVEQDGQKYILAKTTLKMLTNEPYKIVEEFEGQKLLGKSFVPHYDYLKIDPGKKAFVVIGGDFVTAEEGTGIVTIAAYGEEDMVAMQKDNIQIVLHVDEEGNFKSDVPNWAGRNYLEANPEINEDLKNRNLLYNEESYTHTVPTCWRCHTRLIYAPQNAWYMNIQGLKEQLTKTNEQINWFPEHFKHGRFLNSLQAAPDWCISRSRYWGSPVPVWECTKCEERYVPGSIAELEKLSGKKITNLHKPEIDEVIIPCPKCRSDARRVPEVLDSWVEAGSASFGERHYPFEKDQKIEDFFPPDFIVEYTGQIRAWFYVLHVITNAMLKSIAFKNALVTGVILGTDGRKMSKNYGNYPDPKELLQKYGGDALRLYLLGAPVMHGEDIRISEEEYRNQVRTFLLTLWNVYSFFVTFANLSKWNPGIKTASKNILDRWILDYLNKTNADITKFLEIYDTANAIDQLKRFTTDLSTWYIRRSRDRMDGEFFATCYEVLVTLCKILAPFTPFIAEEMFKNLTGKESVHLVDWPSFAKATEGQAQIIRDMEIVRSMVEKVHSERKNLSIKLRQPLAALYLPNKNLQNYEQIIKEELNVKKVEFYFPEHLIKSAGDKTYFLDTTLTSELIAEGKARDLVREIQEARKTAGTALDEKIVVQLSDWPKEFEEYIKKETLASRLEKAETLTIVRPEKNNV